MAKVVRQKSSDAINEEEKVMITIWRILRV